MTIILGIDPGSIKTGFGIVESQGKNCLHIAHGFVGTKTKAMSQRLLHIYQELNQIIQTYQPEESAIESVFMQTNIQSALKLGQARGAALVAVASYAIPIHEYSPCDIKKTTTGFGAASKEQMQYMIKTQLGLPAPPQADAADALAIALCHAQYKAYYQKIPTQAKTLV